MSRAASENEPAHWCCVVALALLAVTSSACEVGVVGEDYPPGAYPPGAYDDYPPDEYIATAEPAYVDGHAAYWYGDRWYYRDRGHWNHYDREPPALYHRRMAAPLIRRTYEPYRGHAAVHARAGSSGGGHGRHH